MEQYIFLMTRFHPWAEDVNKFILDMEGSGIFTAWGDQPVNIDLTINPNRKTGADEEVERLGIDLVISLLPLWSD